MKKKTLTIAIALVLVVALAVGATWALLTDSKEITNTFSAGKVIGDGTEFTLVESNVVKDSTGAYVKGEGTTSTGIEYKDVLPGAPIYKDPTVSVKGLVADAYLFVVVTDKTGDGLTATVDTANWTKLGESRWKRSAWWKPSRWPAPSVWRISPSRLPTWKRPLLLRRFWRAIRLLLLTTIPVVKRLLLSPLPHI